MVKKNVVSEELAQNDYSNVEVDSCDGSLLDNVTSVSHMHAKPKKSQVDRKLTPPNDKPM